MTEKPPSLRERQAQFTRQEILTAARRLFAERGYSRTTMRDIADAAGVSAQTVYDSIGSKQSLVAHLNDLIDTEAGIAIIATTAAESGDPMLVAGLPAKITRSILENCGDIIHALVTGAAAEPELAVVLAEGQRRHIEGARTVVGLLRDLHALPPSVTADAAVDTLSAISDIQFALLLLDSYGWTLDRIETWIATTSQALVLSPTRPPRPPNQTRKLPGRGLPPVHR